MSCRSARTSSTSVGCCAGPCAEPAAGVGRGRGRTTGCSCVSGLTLGLSVIGLVTCLSTGLVCCARADAADAARQSAAAQAACRSFAGRRGPTKEGDMRKRFPVTPNLRRVRPKRRVPPLKMLRRPQWPRGARPQVGKRADANTRRRRATRQRPAVPHARATVKNLARGRGLERGVEERLEPFVGALGGATAVDVDRRRAVDADALAVEEVALDLLPELPRIERGVEARAVETERRRVELEVVHAERRLVAEEQRDVLPVLPLHARRLRRLGRLERVLVDREREVADDEADAVAVLGG